MNRIMIPASPSARYLAVFSLFFCLSTFVAAALAFAAVAVKFKDGFAIMIEIYAR